LSPLGARSKRSVGNILATLIADVMICPYAAPPKDWRTSGQPLLEFQV